MAALRLPAETEDLNGLRAARWIRESTRGQMDNFGPDAQREQQDRAIERYGLIDTGITWQVAQSGRTAWSSDAFVEMMSRAGGDFDVLVVGYASRFLRNLKQTLIARDDLHDRGAVLVFVDERLLSSSEDRWDEFVREAHEAESYSRKLARRIREGYAAKRRRLGEPGGRPPFGFVRRGRPPRLERGEGIVLVRRAYRDAAAGATDRVVAARAGLALDTVRGILTNPIYVGRLRDGSPAAVDPVVDVVTWEAVQRVRASRARTGGHTRRQRVYALPMLRCAACGRRLIGDSGRYRHLEPCQGFTAARRRRAWKNQLVKAQGSSYPASFYEDLVAYALQAIAIQTPDLVAGAAWYADQKPAPDELALRRVTAEREKALSRYSRDRDVVALERAMGRLDADEENIRTSGHPVQPPDWHDVVELLRDLPRLWADPDARPEDRRALAVAAFQAVDALGARSVTFTMTPPASGVQVVVGVGARGVEPTVTITRAPWLFADVERTFGRGG